MRLLSLTAGSIVLIGGLYVAVGERMAGTSADATVNAFQPASGLPVFFASFDAFAA